jgi:L-aspartate oxidase
MEAALAVIAEIEAHNRAPRFRNALTAARMIATGALARTESRGGHFRSDYPDHDPAWRHRTYMTLSEAEATAPLVARSPHQSHDHPAAPA